MLFYHSSIVHRPHIVYDGLVALTGPGLKLISSSSQVITPKVMMKRIEKAILTGENRGDVDY